MTEIHFHGRWTNTALTFFILGICILVFKLTLTYCFLHHIFIRLQKNSPQQHFEGNSTMSAVITFQKSLLSVRSSPAWGLVVTSCHDDYPLTSLALGRSVDKYTIICKKFQANCFSLSPFPTKVKQEKGKNKRKVKQRNELYSDFSWNYLFSFIHFCMHLLLYVLHKVSCLTTMHICMKNNNTTSKVSIYEFICAKLVFKLALWESIEHFF